MGDETTGEVDLSPASRAELRDVRKQLDVLARRVAHLESTHGSHLEEHDGRLDAHDIQFVAIGTQFERMGDELKRDFSGLVDRVTSELGLQKIQLQHQTRTLETINSGVMRMLVHQGLAEKV